MHHSARHHKSEEKPKTLEKNASTPEANAEDSQEISYNTHDVKTLLEWSAPSRPFRRRERTYYLNLLLLMFVLLVILFLFSQYILMLVVISFAFVSYALASTPPVDNRYRLSTEGIAIDDHYYLWQELYDFYFKERGRSITLHIRTKDFLPGELIMLLGDIPKDRMRNVLIRFLPYREIVKSSFSERVGDWLYKTFPLDEPRAV